MTLDKLNNLLEKNGKHTILFYITAAFVMHLDRFILGPHAMIKTHDQFDSYWPFQKVLAERIVNFQMPGWLPDFAGGTPFFMWDVNWMYFPVIIHGLIPEPWSITAITIAQFLIAGLGAHLFFRYFFGTDELTSLLGGLLWAVSTFNLTYWRISDLATIPFMLYCTDRLAFASDRKTRVLMIGGLLLCAMNLWLIKGAIFFVPFHFFFVLFVHRSWIERRRVYFSCGLFWTFVAILNLPMIASLLTNATYSSRKLIQWFPWDRSLLEALDNIFTALLIPIHVSAVNLGFVASLIVFFSLYQFKQSPKLAKNIFYYYIAVVFFAQFIAYSSWFISFWQSLPISGFRLYRILVIGPLVFFIFGVINFNSFIKFLQGSLRQVFLFTIIIAAIFCVYHFERNVFPSNYIELFVVMFFAAATLSALIVLRKKDAGTKAYVILFMVLIFSERFVHANMMRPADVHPPSFTHFYSSDLFDRFRSDNKYDYRIAFINQHPVVGLYNGHQVAGGIGQYSKRYYYFWDALITGDEDSKAFHDYYHMAYLYADRVKREASPAHKISQPGFSTDLLALHNVRYIFSFNEIENPGRWGLSLVHEGTPPERHFGLKRGIQVFKRIFKSIPYYVYEVNACLPRTFTTPFCRLVDGNDDLKIYLRKARADELRKNVVYNREDLTGMDIDLLKKMISPAMTKARKPVRANSPQVVYYSDNKIIIHAASDMPQQLVLNENYFRDWTATVNGRPVTILPAYGVFRSVILEKGENEVVFEYRPSYLVNSLWVSGLGSIAFLAVCLGWAFFYRKPEGNEL